MSIFIKGMSIEDLEIENCDSCCISFYCEFDQHMDGYLMDGGRPPFCPLNEVTASHGRLIDADVLCERLVAKWPTADESGKKIIPEVMNDVVTPIIVETPTVIEAEGE